MPAEPTLRVVEVDYFLAKRGGVDPAAIAPTDKPRAAPAPPGLPILKQEKAGLLEASPA